MFKQLADKINLSAVEKEILEYWKVNNIFEKSILTRSEGKNFTFYEGPPTANGKPGIHHVMARTVKDIICRYKTLCGYRVNRKAGWDTQGLPVEIEVEKILGIKTKSDIENFGIENFNKACMDSVFKYLSLWEELTERMGYWINLKDAYITYRNEYIESVWWSLKKFFDAGLIYRGFKIQPYCPRCETPLSSHEVAQGYEDVKDPSVYVKFKIREGQGLDGYYMLVWTTTPWTLISNVALCVGSEITYVKVKLSESGEHLILAKDRLSVLNDEYQLLGELKGRELEKLEYEQLFRYVTPEGKAFYITLGDFVTTEDGSGVVHIAPAFGEDDYQISLKYKLPFLQPVDESGRFTDEVTDYAGRFVKDTDDDIIQKLKTSGRLYRKEKFVHSYPHCWRCHSPLLYYARESWYINTSSYKDDMIRLNHEIMWHPPETGSGRFGNWLEENRDWALSRDRYWGTPLPIWECISNDCNFKYEAIGSIQELKDKSVNFIEVYPTEGDIDLHKPYIDKIKIRCSECGCEMHRVSEVIDAWYDSGSMPFAQYHYPFENNEVFEKNYPADFIAEGIDQTRGWFYSLHAIGTFLFKEKAFKTLIVNDLILDKQGRKMSKHLGNVVDPFVVMDKYGADILRWYLVVSSPPWRPKMFNEDDLLEVRNKFFDTLINTYRFFVLYCQINGLTLDALKVVDPTKRKNTEIDRWIISAYNSTLKKFTELMDSYDITRAARMLSDFLIDDVSNWYVRRNRRRFRSPADELDKLSAYSTLHEVLTGALRMTSPFSPFVTDMLYRELTDEDSVHLSYLGLYDEKLIDEKLESSMKIAQTIVSLVRAMRVKSSLKTRQPLRKLLVSVLSEWEREAVLKMKNVILEEVNIKELELADVNSTIIKKKAKLNFKTAGPRFGKDVKTVNNIVSNLSQEEIDLLIKTGEIEKDGFKIASDNVSVLTEDIPGWMIGSDAGITVAIDTELDEELISEGIAREFVSKVQAVRKELNMDVSEKVSVIYSSDEEIMNIVKSKEKYIAEETMASEIIYSEKGNLNGSEEINLNGRVVRISVRKN